jgi:phospholipase C
LPTRRRAIEQLGYGLGLGALGASSAGCGLGPDRCAGGPPPEDLASVASHALLRDIDTFVVVMLENRSFDHLLGALALDPRYPAAGRVDGLTGEEFNLDLEGRPVPVARMPGRGDGSFNPAHDFASVRRTWNDGRNDSFVRVNAGHHQQEVMGYLARDQLPFLHELAGAFTVCDRWFASYMGQTWPNRYYLHAGTSAGRRENRPLGFDAPPTVWERLAERCHRGKNYAAGPVLWYSVAFPAKAFSGADALRPAPIEEFFRDARRGDLPELAVIDPDFKVSDFYPEHDVSLAEAFVASVYRALAESPQWSRSLLVVTFDEHGGYFDHVAPPVTVDPRPEFRQLGFRVPALVIGPHVWQGGVVSTVFEHVSIAATMRARFGIRSLGPRMDAAADLSSCIDPARVGRPAPAPTLGPVEVPARLVRAGAVRASSQGELEAALRARAVPEEHVDVRSDDARFASWLRLAQELEAVRVRS